MIYSQEVENMCPVAQGVHHGAAPIPEEAKWVQAKEVKDISGFTHGVGWCAPQQGACKMSSRSISRDNRLLRYDTFCCYGNRDPSGSDGYGGTEY